MINLLILKYIIIGLLKSRDINTRGRKKMTVALLICAIPPKGTPFVMIAADSLATTMEKDFRDEKAIKIFDAGNALMTTSGSVNDEYREDVARILRDKTDGTIEDKMFALKQILAEDKQDHGLEHLNVGLVQFDEEGNPQIGLSGVNVDADIDPVYGPVTYEKNSPRVEHLYMGVTKTLEINELINQLSNKLVEGKITKSSIENAAKWFIRKVAHICPDQVNGVVQIKILRYKQ